MAADLTRGDPSTRNLEQLAAFAWLGAALIYTGSEAAAAIAFSPRYSYADNYISDLGVTVCGTIFDNRAICSPLHGLINVGFSLQGLAFLVAALAISRGTSAYPATSVLFVAFAALNAIGNVLLGVFPENAPGRLGDGASYHILGALLAIVCGNATVLTSAWAFAGLRLPGYHRVASVVLPVLAAVSFTMLLLARGSGGPLLVRDGIWERISVYTITTWELLSAFCVFGRAREA